MPALAPSPKFRAVGSNGLALVGGKLYSYTAGTSTPKDTYTSFTLGAANTNPVILDARGECNLWLNGNYKLVLKDSTDATIWTVDDIRDLTSSATFTNATLAGTLTVSSTAVTWSGNPTHSGNHTFANNVTISGNTTLGDSSADTITINPNAVTWVNAPTHSSNHTYSGNVTVQGVTTLSGATTLTGVATFSAIPAGKIVPGTYTPAFTLTTNITTATKLLDFYYIRVGNNVLVSGSVNITPTGAGACKLRISLPFSASFSGGELSGVGSDDGALHRSGRISASAANNAEFAFTAASASISTFAVNFMYIGAT